MEKIESIASVRNREPILKELQKIIKKEEKNNILEIGTGTGQHAVHMAAYFKNIIWQTSDKKENHEIIKSWIKDSGLDNVKEPVEFEIGKDDFPKGEYDTVYTANTFHIMSCDHCKELIRLCGDNIEEGSKIIIYGAFKYNNNHTSSSNREFDYALRENNYLSGIRNYEEVEEEMSRSDFQKYKDISMPNNNKMLMFKKI